MPDFSQNFIVETDASGFGVGAVLMQNSHPIAFFSKVLGQRARLKSIYEKELMAIVLAVLKWKHYLLGRRFIVRTDQQSLKFLLEQREVGPEYQKWVNKLMGFEFEIHYRPGASNKVADALSRPPNYTNEQVRELSTLTSVGGVFWDEVQEAIQNDPFILQMKRDLESGKPVHKDYQLDHGVLKYKGRTVLSPNCKLIARLLHMCHDTPMGGHSGELKTYQRIASSWFWPGMRKAITLYVQHCHICQQAKASTLKPAGLLNPLPIPTTVWEEISMDFIEGLPRSEGFNSVLVVVDRLTKYAHFLPLKHPFTAQNVASLFVKEVVRLHGFPMTIVSDRDKIFLSQFWKDLFKLQGTSLHHSTAYHPQSDGQTEVVNKCLETYLRCFIQGKDKAWAKWLPWAEFWYNTTKHSSTGFTPFKALYGRDPPPVVKSIPGSTGISSLEDQLQERDAILDELKAHLLRAQQRMKAHEDQSRREVEFKVNDLVYLKLQPFRQQSVVRRLCNKLAARYYGPFRVVQRIGTVAYKLELPATSHIHPVFHVSQLKPAIGPLLPCSDLPVSLQQAHHNEVFPAQVLGVRQAPFAAAGELEVLIQWEGQPDFEATWELYSNMSQLFPSFHLEDKVAVWAAGNAVNSSGPPIRFTYVRRPKKKN